MFAGSMEGKVSEDWGNRQFSESMQFNLLAIVDFLNDFDSATRQRLAQINSKLTALERYVDVLESILSEARVGEDENISNDIQIQFLRQGHGDTLPSPDSTVTLSYAAYLPDGSLFEKHDAESPIQVQMGTGSLIPGLEQALMSMVAGTQVRVTIPPHLAYGDEGLHGSVPPSSTVIFDVFLASVD